MSLHESIPRNSVGHCFIQIWSKSDSDFAHFLSTFYPLFVHFFRNPLDISIFRSNRKTRVCIVPTRSCIVPTRLKSKNKGLHSSDKILDKKNKGLHSSDKICSISDIVPTRFIIPPTRNTRVCIVPTRFWPISGFFRTFSHFFCKKVVSVFFKRNL